MSDIIKEAKARNGGAKEDDLQGVIIIHIPLQQTFICMHFACAVACERYFRSLYEDYSRELNNTKDRHRKQQRLLQRKKQVFLCK